MFYKTCGYILLYLLMITPAIIVSVNLLKHYYKQKTYRLVLPEKRPKVNVYIPCHRIYDHIEKNIDSILNQNYPNYHAYFIVHSKAEYVYSFLDEYIKNKNNASVIISPNAEKNVQKIENLIFATTTYINCKILVFFDSDAHFQNDTITRLVSPIICNESPVTTSPHYVKSEKKNLSSVSRMIFEAYQQVHVAGFTSVHGACYAIDRDFFIESKISEYWEGMATDDVSLTRLVKSNNCKIKIVYAEVFIAIDKLDIYSSFYWFLRQTLLLKFCSTPLWLIALIFAISGLLVLVGPILSFFHFAPIGREFAFGILFLTAFIIFLAQKKAKMNIPFLPFLLFFWPSNALISCAVLISLIKKNFRWGGIVYSVDSKGKILKTR